MSMTASSSRTARLRMVDRRRGCGLGDRRRYPCSLGRHCAVGILLIVADLVLPVPQASVITALGAIYGIALGTLIGTVGLILNGVAGYLLMSTPVRRVIERALKGRQ